MVDNISPTATWTALQDDPQAWLVDVRTNLEWTNIGVPDLAAADKHPVLVQWQTAPAMAVNPDFVAELIEAGISAKDHIYFICRSGVRSLAAAQTARAAGFPHVYNVADGFEGPPDATGQRGKTAGWQADSLPWRLR